MVELAILGESDKLLVNRNSDTTDWLYYSQLDLGNGAFYFGSY
jgi:hypothetical protein